MAKVTVFVFVEGKDVDPYFYGEICHRVLADANVSYEIVRASRIAQSGGKEPLLGFYSYLSATGSLLTTFQGKRLAAIFFLDKDIDDVLHEKRHSDHIVYTEHYSVENHLFVEGDLAHAAASASSLERREFAAALGDETIWRRERAEAWKDWITFCVFAQKHRVDGGYNYRLAGSTFNDPIDVPPDAATVDRHRALLENRSRMTPERFEKAFRSVVRLVNGYFHQGRHDRLFRGKWYVAFLEAQIDRVAAGRAYSTHALSNKILSALGPTVDFSAPWAEHFRAPVRALVERL